jgi:glucose-fructose oxidoreductase
MKRKTQKRAETKRRSQTEPVRFAVVGLGHFAQAAILPAFANARKDAQLAALVTGDKEKAAKLSRKYQAPAHSYDEYDELLGSGEIDAVYVATPNSEHRTYTERAAAAGVHVLCEKPLAYSVQDAEAMIRACRKADVRLMTAYRLHFEEGNLQAIEAVQKGKIGEPRLFISTHTMQVDPDNTRIDKSLGGGPLEDIGIYCLNAVRYLFQAEPVEVLATAVHGDDPRFEEVPESVSATLRFPDDRLATFVCGFGTTKLTEYRVVGRKGVLTMDPAFTWQGDIKQEITIKDKAKSKTFKHRDQIAAEIVYFSGCVRKAEEPEPSGREGLIDVRIIDALRQSYAKGRAIKLKPLPPDKKPQRSQAIHRPAHREPELVKAEPPGQG